MQYPLCLTPYMATRVGARVHGVLVGERVERVGERVSMRVGERVSERVGERVNPRVGDRDGPLPGDMDIVVVAFVSASRELAWEDRPCVVGVPDLPCSKTLPGWCQDLVLPAGGCRLLMQVPIQAQTAKYEMDKKMRTKTRRTVCQLTWHRPDRHLVPTAV